MAIKLGGSEDSNGDLAEINIIPLVDVMLVLLIVFMVAAPLSIAGINVNLPTSKARGSRISEDRIVLSISQKGDYYFEKLRVSQAALPEKMKAIFEYRQNKELYIRADRGVKYGRVVDAMSAAKMAGVNRMSMLTKSDNRKG